MYFEEGENVNVRLARLLCKDLFKKTVFQEQISALKVMYNISLFWHVLSN